MAPQALAGPDYDTALNYYKQKQYEKAAVHFLKPACIRLSSSCARPSDCQFIQNLLAEKRIVGSDMAELSLANRTCKEYYALLPFAGLSARAGI